MKKLFFFNLLLALLTLGCSNAPVPETQETTPEETNPQDPQPEDPNPEDPQLEDPQPEKPASISILAIGNSFSVDAMQYLWDILNEDGAQEIHLGNLYIGGCTLETHAGHFQANNAAYTYYTNSTGEWTSQASYKPLDALQEREWDYITMQQSSGVSGIESSYDPYLETLVGIVKEHCPKSKLLWHMTWAYQGDSNHSSYPTYGYNQMTMYNAILDVVSNKHLPIVPLYLGAGGERSLRGSSNLLRIQPAEL